MTKQGAASPFLRDTLERIANSLGLSHQEYLSRLPQSFMLSADNAHAFHPEYPEKCDPVNQPVIGGGVGAEAQRQSEIRDRRGLRRDRAASG